MLDPSNFTVEVYSASHMVSKIYAVNFHQKMVVEEPVRASDHLFHGYSC